MDGALQRNIETAVDTLAAALYGAAAAVIAYRFGAMMSYAAAAGTLAAGWCFYGLRSLRPVGREFKLAAFETIDLPEALPILDLTEPAPAPDANELLLEDVLAAVGTDARVVRLFDPAAMPSPAELKARVDGYLDGGSSATAPPDASQALFDALSELRRSMR